MKMDRTKVPLGGFWFHTDPETRRPFYSTRSWDALVGQVEDFYRGCGREIPSDLEDQIECQMVARDAKPINHSTVILKCSRMFANQKPVAARTAEERAEICRRCSCNDFGLGLLFKDTAARLREMLGTVSCDAWLGLCNAHMVPASALVFLKNVPETGVAGCWCGTREAP